MNSTKKKILHFSLILAALVLFTVATLLVFPRSQFILGGALVNAGYRLQDGLHDYDLTHHDAITPEQVWSELESQNSLAAAVRNQFPRSSSHPIVAIFACMDSRIDTNELAGDTRRNYYIIRTAGSVMGPAESDMLELAVSNGVKLVILTRHTDCAAEKAAKDPEMQQRFPELVKGVEERAARVHAFLARPFIAKKVATGELLVKDLLVDTTTERLVAPSRH